MAILTILMMSVPNVRAAAVSWFPAKILMTTMRIREE